MTTTTTPSGAADLPEALRRSTAADGKTELFNLPGYPLMVRAVDFNRIHTESEMRRTALLDEMQKATLAAGRATAAQAVVQDDLITIRRPTTRAEMLWLLKLAHLVISDVGKTLEETLAPAQPAAQQEAAYAELPDEREMLKHALWLASSLNVYRYLMSNAEGRWSGAEKATCHDELCRLYVAVFRGVEVDRVRVDLEADWMAVHDATQELTDHMDVVIGFPLKGVPDYESLAPKFFAYFHRLATHALRAPHGQAPATQQAGEVRRAELVPGVMHCAKCKFQLNRVTLCVSDGNAYAGNNKTEPCPNGCGPLWPVTWEQEAKNCWKALEEMHERLMAAAAPQPSPTTQSADSVPAVSDLPPLPAPDLRDVGTKPREIKEFLKGYATEYVRTAIAASARAADSVLEDAARYRFLRDGEWRDTDLEPFIRLQLNTLWDAKIDAAIKQGEKQ